MEPIVYDDLNWHLQGEIDAAITPQQVAVYMGFYLRWLYENDFLADDFVEANEAAFMALDDADTGAAALFVAAGGKLASNMLNVEGILFTNLYYLNGCFYANLEQAMGEFEGVAENDQHAMYRLQETAQNYAVVKERIDFYLQETLRFSLRFLLNTVEDEA